MDRNDNFNCLRDDILAGNYRERDITLSFFKQNIFSFVVSIPFVALAVLSYGFSDFKEFVTSKPLSVFETFLFVAFLLIMFLTHEHLHALGYVPFLKKRWTSIDVWVDKRSYTPNCYFGEALNRNQYIFGTMLPLLILAVLPIVVGLLIDISILFLIGLLNIFLCGDDMIFTFAAVFYADNNSLILAHPQKCGCIIYSK